jgi:pimeloyl-ACP methyl ester carboxylesterase
MRTADQTFPAVEWDAPQRTLRLPAPELHKFTTQDGVVLRAVRYKGGEAGPVIFATHNGGSNKIALLDTVDTNLAEYLVERGHDLWLFDWRGSPDVDCPGFSLHDVARYDWPSAVKYIIAQSGAPQVDCVTFCAGGITLLMALAAGYLKDVVRSVVCLQASLIFVTPWPARLKAAAHLPGIFETLGWGTYRQGAVEPSVFYKLLDGILKLHPVPPSERCDSPSCRRMMFCYGQVVRHANLNEATHARLPAIFGVSSFRSIRDLSGAVRKGRIAPLDDAALKNLRLPITFIHGAENRVVLPESAGRLHEALATFNSAALYQMAITPGYGHFDGLVSERSIEDIFPIIGAHLDRWSGKGKLAVTAARPETPACLPLTTRPDQRFQAQAPQG